MVPSHKVLIMYGMVLRELTARELLMPWCKKFIIIFFYK